MKHLQARLRILEGTLQDLCLNIGERPTGSANNRLAQEYIRHQFELQGYQVEVQEFECIDWHSSGTSLRMGDRQLQAYSAPYSLPCDLNTPFQLLGNINQLNGAELRGKIAVLHGDLTREALMPKNFRFWNPEEHQRIIRLLEEKQPAAVITVSKGDVNQTPIPIIEDGDFNIPCAMLSEESARPLFDQPSTTLALKIGSMRTPTKAANVIARSQAAGAPENNKRKKIVLSAHLDTKPGTPGALDDASGVAALLLLGELLKYKRDQIALEFVCFNGEDHYSNAGEVTYLDRNKNLSKEILFNINIDGVGYKYGKMGLSYHTCPTWLVSRCEHLLQGDQRIEVIEPWPQGDHMLFVMNHVPAITFTSIEAMPLVDKIIHTDKDTLELLDLTSILGVVEFIFQLVIQAGKVGLLDK